MRYFLWLHNCGLATRDYCDDQITQQRMPRVSELFSLVSPSLTAFNTRKSHNRCYEYIDSLIIYLVIKGSDTYITWWLLIGRELCYL